MSSEVAVGVLGGLIGALVTLVGQWLLGPPVERRVRAQQRWEEHVLEAGRVVTEQLPRARQRLRDRYHDWLQYGVLAVRETDPNRREPLERRRWEITREAAKLHEEWVSLADERLGWLANRIRRHPEDGLYMFEARQKLYAMHLWVLRPASWDRIQLGGAESEDTALSEDPAWSTEREVYADLAAEIERLASTIVPFPLSRWQRASRKYRSWRSTRTRERD